MQRDRLTTDLRPEIEHRAERHIMSYLYSSTISSGGLKSEISIILKINYSSFPRTSCLYLNTSSAFKFFKMIF